MYMIICDTHVWSKKKAPNVLSFVNIEKQFERNSDSPLQNVIKFLAPTIICFRITFSLYCSPNDPNSKKDKREKKKKRISEFLYTLMEVLRNEDVAVLCFVLL